MKEITRRSGYWFVGAGVGLAALSIFSLLSRICPDKNEGDNNKKDRRPAQPTGIRDLSGR